MKFYYDPEANCGYIGNQKKKVRYSREFLDAFVVDFDYQNKIVGVEIIDAKEVLRDFGIEIKNIENVEIKVKHAPNYLIIILLFKAKDKVRNIAIPVSPMAMKVA